MAYFITLLAKHVLHLPSESHEHYSFTFRFISHKRAGRTRFMLTTSIFKHLSNFPGVGGGGEKRNVYSKEKNED